MGIENNCQSCHFTAANDIYMSNTHSYIKIFKLALTSTFKMVSNHFLCILEGSVYIQSFVHIIYNKPA